VLRTETLTRPDANPSCFTLAILALQLSLSADSLCDGEHSLSVKPSATWNLQAGRPSVVPAKTEHRKFEGRCMFHTFRHQVRHEILKPELTFSHYYGIASAGCLPPSRA